MKHYKDPNTNELYAYEADGSQDDFIKPGLVAVTDQEAEQLRQAALAPLVASRQTVGDPVEKLKAFLAANPDVAKVLNGG